MSYRPICDTWILARPKVKYYGAYPSGFLGRARHLLGVQGDDAVLHVCSGRVKDYPFSGFGPNDKTLDLDEQQSPDFHEDCSVDWRPWISGQGWKAILTDPPYTEDDAEHYAPGASKLPKPNKLLKLCLEHVRPGGRVGFLHYVAPRPPKELDGCKIKLVAVIGVMMGYDNRARFFSVYEKELP